jgi:hypothetical protein
MNEIKLFNKKNKIKNKVDILIWLFIDTITEKVHYLLPSFHLSAWTIGLVTIPPPPFFFENTLPFMIYGEAPMSQSAIPKMLYFLLTFTAATYSYYFYLSCTYLDWF